MPIIARPASTRLVCWVSSRASKSFMIAPFTAAKMRMSPSRWVVIHRSRVSATISWGALSWRTRSSCRSGWVAARNTNLLSANCGGIFGPASCSTLSSMPVVSASAFSPAYEPDQRKVLLPLRTSSPARSICWRLRKALKSAGKSSPTTPTNRTGVYSWAASAKYTAEPPYTSVACPAGVLTVSIPILPVTSSDIRVSLYCIGGMRSGPQRRARPRWVSVDASRSPRQPSR